MCRQKRFSILRKGFFRLAATWKPIGNYSLTSLRGFLEDYNASRVILKRKTWWNSQGQPITSKGSRQIWGPHSCLNVPESLISRALKVILNRLTTWARKFSSGWENYSKPRAIFLRKKKLVSQRHRKLFRLGGIDAG